MDQIAIATSTMEDRVFSTKSTMEDRMFSTKIDCECSKHSFSEIIYIYAENVAAVIISEAITETESTLKPYGSKIPLECIPNDNTKSECETVHKTSVDIDYISVTKKLVSVERVETFTSQFKIPTLNLAQHYKINNSKKEGKAVFSKAKKKRLKHKNKYRILSSKHKIAKRTDQFAASLEEESNEFQEDQQLLCPICLDVFYNAHVCEPCGHQFCEPCLRRLAKYNSASGKTTCCCPICREPIHHCLKNYDLSQLMYKLFPDDLRRRRRTDANTKYMKHPLPCETVQTMDSAIVSHILRQRQHRQQRRNHPFVRFNPMRLSFTRFLSIAVIFVVVKIFVLMLVIVVYNAVLVG